MPTPRTHADKAALFFSDSSMRCWYRKNSRHQWEEVTDPCFVDGEQYHVGLTSPVEFVALTLHVPQPMREQPKSGVTYWYLDADYEHGYGSSRSCSHTRFLRGVWRTEEEIKTVVAALEAAVNSVQK